MLCKEYAGNVSVVLLKCSFLTCHNVLMCLEHVAFYALLLEAAVEMLKRCHGSIIQRLP